MIERIGFSSTPHLSLGSLPLGVLVLLGVLLVAELALEVVALVSLSRLPKARVTLGSKWVWVAIILLVNLVGAILYFAVGRRPATPIGAAPPQTTPSSGTTVADELYGRPDETGAR